MIAKFLLIAAVAGAAWAQPAPVVVELFTSEGCSSCPPADALLEYLDRSQPVTGARIIVLSEHVDYWDHLGWKDPHSSSAFTARQESYARRFARDPYTPQIVVDGRTAFVGSDRDATLSAIRSSVRETKLAVRITPAPGGGDTVRIEADPLPAGKSRKAEVYVAYAAESGASDVSRGENRGHKLHHVAIVTELRQLGKLDQREGFRVELPAPTAGSRLIAFVQEPGTGHILGAAVLPAK